MDLNHVENVNNNNVFDKLGRGPCAVPNCTNYDVTKKDARLVLDATQFGIALNRSGEFV